MGFLCLPDTTVRMHAEVFINTTLSPTHTELIQLKVNEVTRKSQSE